MDGTDYRPLASICKVLQLTFICTVRNGEIGSHHNLLTMGGNSVLCNRYFEHVVNVEQIH